MYIMEKTNAIKILAIVCQMNRRGLESRLMDIIRYTDNDQVCIDIFTYREQPGLLDSEVKSFGSTVYYNPPLTVKNMFWYVNYFKNFLKEHQEYKIVHAYQDAWCSVFCKGAYLAGVPVRIAHSRTAISTLSINNIVKNIIKIPTRKYATHYFAVSDLAGEWLFGKKNVQEGKVQIWKNAIDCNKFRFNEEKRSHLRNTLKIENKKVIMHVGNFTATKNQIFLLDVLKELLKEDESFCMFFIGGETKLGLQRNLRLQAEKMGIQSSVFLLGNRSDVNDLLQAGDVFCFPSLYEGLPGAVLEAQAAGLPCIISDTITQEVIVLKTTKMLSLKAGTEVWKKEIVKATEISRRDTYDEMVRAGFDIQNLVKELTNFYEMVGRNKNAV